MSYKHFMSELLLVFLMPSLFAFQDSPMDFSYPELDKQLLSLWLAADQKNGEVCYSSIEAIEAEWQVVKESLEGKEVLHINIPEFSNRVEAYVKSLRPCASSDNWSCLKSIAYHLMYEFRSLRQCLFKTEYPVDVLWESIDSYNRIKRTINDRMFDLRDWFEFEDQVNDFICKWEYYDLRHINEIHEYFPGINNTKHSELKNDIKSCIVRLLESIDTGYQSNFVLPCDELGAALQALLKMYSESKVIMLM